MGLAKKFTELIQWDLGFLRESHLGPLKASQYILSKYPVMLLGRSEINWLGQTFRFDNRFQPAILQTYLLELQNLLEVIGPGPLNNVLDIGGNVGQFSATLTALRPDLVIDVFEPNPTILPLLRQNLSHLPKVRVFPYGIAGTESEFDLFYIEGKSAQGSRFAENARQNLMGVVRSVKVQAIPLSKTHRQRLGLADVYDLIKIDVEGAEQSVLEGLKGVRTKWVYLELSSGRTSDAPPAEVLRLVQDAFGPFTMITPTPPIDTSQPTQEVLLKFGA